MTRSRSLSPSPLQPPFRPSPSGRYTRTNPPRRIFGLKLLSETLPDTLRTALLRAWLHPRRFDGNQAIQSVLRPRPDEAHLFFFSSARLVMMMQIELEVARRMVEIPGTEITREARTALLRSQGDYLHGLYAALTFQLGEASALAEFTRLLTVA